MGKVKRMILAVPAVLIALIGAYLVIRIVASLMQGYSWQEMDWRQRGRTFMGISLQPARLASEKSIRKERSALSTSLTKMDCRSRWSAQSKKPWRWRALLAWGPQAATAGVLVRRFAQS